MRINPRKKALIFGTLLEAGLGVLAAAAGRILHQDVPGPCQISARGLLLGAVGALPLWAFFALSEKLPVRSLQEIRRLLVRHLYPLVREASWAELALLCLAAGVGEEMLFRAFLQGIATRYAGPVLGLLVASVVFGLAHPVTKVYAVLVSVIGIYLGLLWTWSGNLVVPIIAHGLYDFLALVLFLRELQGGDSQGYQSYPDPAPEADPFFQHEPPEQSPHHD